MQSSSSQVGTGQLSCWTKPKGGLSRFALLFGNRLPRAAKGAVFKEGTYVTQPAEALFAPGPESPMPNGYDAVLLSGRDKGPNPRDYKKKTPASHLNFFHQSGHTARDIPLTAPFHHACRSNPSNAKALGRRKVRKSCTQQPRVLSVFLLHSQGWVLSPPCVLGAKKIKGALQPKTSHGSLTNPATRLCKFA